MKTKLQFATLTLTMVLLAACSVPSQTLQAGQIVLRPGDSIASEDGSIKVTFVQVTEDSRCPTGVQCVWAGQVKVLVEATVGTEVQQYTPVSGTLLEGEMGSIDVGNYTISLVQVEPYPVYGQTIDSADYQITFEVQ